jgi:hypothetical protein
MTAAVAPIATGPEYCAAITRRPPGAIANP